MLEGEKRSAELDGYQMNARLKTEEEAQYLGPRPQRRISNSDERLSGGLVLGRHATSHRHTRVLSASLLLLLEVLVVGHLLLLLSHVARVHLRGATHVGLGRVDVGVRNILRGLGGDIRSIDAILVGGGVRSVQAGLWTRSLAFCSFFLFLFLFLFFWTTKKLIVGGRQVATYLNEVLALGLGDKRLELGSGEGVHKASLGDDQEKHLGASKN